MLVNRTRNKVLTRSVLVADSFLKRATGLMFKREFDGALVFPRVGSTSFHSFFCRFPILILELDEKGRVTGKRVLEPWRVTNVNAHTVVEMDARKEWDVEEGDVLEWRVS